MGEKGGRVMGGGEKRGEGGEEGGWERGKNEICKRE